jgi:DoxX-like family
MEPSTSPAAGSKAMVWTGRVISGLIVLMMAMSGVMKFSGSQQVTEGMTHLGWPVEVVIALGVTELACTLLYAIPQTSVLGAILLTGYLGGAIATHARIGEQFVFQVILGVLVWLGLYLRDGRLRALLPLR